MRATSGAATNTSNATAAPSTTSSSGATAATNSARRLGRSQISRLGDIFAGRHKGGNRDSLVFSLVERYTLPTSPPVTTRANLLLTLFDCSTIPAWLIFRSQ